MLPEFSKETANKYQILIPPDKKEYKVVLGFIGQGIKPRLTNDQALTFADYIADRSGFAAGVQDIMPYIIEDWEQVTAEWVQRKIEKEGFNK